MSRKLPDWAYELDNCTKCHSPSGHCGCSPSCDPVDININVNCCCPEPPPTPGGCCCNEGMAEALRFIQVLQNRGDVESTESGNKFFIDIYGINPDGLATDVTIVNVLNDDIVQVDATNPSGTVYISMCAIYYIDIRIAMNANYDDIKDELREMFTIGESDDCCCKNGIANLLNMFICEEEEECQEVALNLNDADSDSGDIIGEVIALDSDVVWLDTTSGNSQGNTTLTVASICYIASVRPVTTGA